MPTVLCYAESMTEKSKQNTKIKISMSVMTEERMIRNERVWELVMRRGCSNTW